MLTYFPLLVGKCDFIAPDCLPLCLAAVCNEVGGRNDISKHCQRHNRPEFSLAKVTFLGHINFKISTEHQILMSTDCPDDMLSENITKDTMSSLQSPLSKNLTKLKSLAQQLFDHIFPLMSQKYVSVVNEKYILDQ